LSIVLKARPLLLEGLSMRLAHEPSATEVKLTRLAFEQLLADAKHAHELHALINNPHTAEFLRATQIEAAHQRDRWGEAHDRGKSAENWFWLVGYLAGKCLRACITGDRAKALHHTISSAAALANWYEAISKDETGCGIGKDEDIRPVEIARFEGADQVAHGHDGPGGVVPVIRLAADQYSGR
jgi:hypothetical protein